jgi:hypothetical protein
MSKEALHGYLAGMLYESQSAAYDRWYACTDNPPKYPRWEKQHGYDLVVDGEKWPEGKHPSTGYVLCREEAYKMVCNGSSVEVKDRWRERELKNYLGCQIRDAFGDLDVIVMTPGHENPVFEMSAFNYYKENK